MAESEHFTKEQLLKYCNTAKPIPGRNSMGCSESWYDPFFCIQQFFTEDERNAMSEEELNHLYRLADQMSQALY